MSDQTTHAKLDLEVEVRAAEQVRALKADLDSVLKTMKAFSTLKVPAGVIGNAQSKGAHATVEALKAQATAAAKAAGIETRAARQRRADARAEAGDRRMFDRQDMAALRAKLDFRTRMDRQRAAAEAAEIRRQRTAEAERLRADAARLRSLVVQGRQRVADARAAERAEAAAARAAAQAEQSTAAAARRRIADERRSKGDRDRTKGETIRYAERGFTRARDAVRDITRPPAAVAAVGAAGATAGARRALTAEADIDASEIATRQYGGLDAKAARALRNQWAAPLAEALGVETPKLLNAWTDAVKLGIPASGAKAFAELSTQTSEAWGIGFENVVDTFGTINTLLTSKGASFDIGKLKSAANTLQHLAAKQSTTPEKLITFLKQGAGGADLLGMSMESALAFGSASTSLGNKAGESGTLLDYLAGRIVEMPRLTKKKGEEGKQARQLVADLGYSSASEMDQKRREDPDGFLPDFIERFSKIENAKKQEEAIRFTFGREWLGEASRIIKGADTYREAVKLQKEAKGLDAIGAVWDLHKLKLSFVFRQFKSGWVNILGEFGKVLSPMARQAGDYFLGWSEKLRAGGLADRFKAAIEGAIEGLGFRDLPELLKGMFGAPGEGDAGGVAAWRSTFREFAAGISDVVGSIKSVVGAFTGGDPETIARWTGRFLAFSAAAVALGPVLGIIGGFLTAIMAIGAAFRAMGAGLRLLTGAAGIGGAGAAAGGGILARLGLAGLGARLLGGLGLGIVAELGAHRGKIVTVMLDSIRWFFGSIAMALRKALSLKGIVGALGAIGQEFVPAWLERWIQNDGGGTGAGAPAGGSSGGPGGASPSSYNGVGAGSASSNAANPTASSAMLDAIAGTESGAAGYDAVLGNGKYGTPDKPVSSMTIDEAHAFGRQILARHGSSSALGRYQIVGNTMRDAQRAMNISGDAKFDAAMQDRMARWVARTQGLGAWEGLKSNPNAMAAARAAMAQGGAVEGPAGATASGGATGAVDVATKYLGMNEIRDNAALKGFVGREVIGAQNAWCAGFVNSSLKAVGLKGTGSGIANSFLGWGQGVDASEVAKGDVLVEHRGKGLNAAGGHVGFATGQTRPGPNGGLQIEMISGNNSNGVGKSWEDASTVAVRRSTEAIRAAAAAATATVSGPVQGGRATAPSEAASGVSARPTAHDLAGAARPNPGAGLGPQSALGGMDGGMGGNIIHAPVNIHGANMSASELSGTIQRHLAEARGYRTHDMEPELT